MPSLFFHPGAHRRFQVWFVVYLYLLPILLYAAWVSLSIMDLVESKEIGARWPAVAVLILIPWFGGAWYLLARARALTRTARCIAIVGCGAIVWLIPLAVAIWLVVRPLGPKALG